MKFTPTVLILILTLALILSAPIAAAGDYWIRFGASLNFPGMSDFNDGIAQMNALARDGMLEDLAQKHPNWTDAQLQDELDGLSGDNLLDELDQGFGVSIALARRLGLGTCVGLEYERMMGLTDVVYNPAIAMDYSAPMSMAKVFLNTHVKEMGRLSLGVGGAVGWAKADGWLTMPANNPRTAMRDAYLTGGGLLLEGQLLSHYRLEEGVSVCLTVGYRRAELKESDQHWFRERPGTAPVGDDVELDDSIPLKLDFSGLFIKAGCQVALPY